MTTLLQDLRYAVRVLAKKPGFTLVAVLTLALGIGANTAIFSLVSAVLVRPLNYRDAERLVMVWEDASVAGVPRDNPSGGSYADWKAQNTVFEDLAAVQQLSFDLAGEGEPEKVYAYAVTQNFFPLLGAEAARGRTFLPEEDRPGANRVAVISHGLWQSRFGGEPAVVGRDILLSGEKYTVVGVMPAGFQFEYPDVGVWVPAALTPEQLADRVNHYLEVVARLKPGVSAEQAQAEVQTLMGRISAAYPDAVGPDIGAAVVPLREQFAGEARRPLLMLLAAVALVLLIACANVAGVLLSRAAARRREMAVRAALGASRWRIVRQLLTESVLLGAAGGVAGALLALWAFGFLQQLVPAGLRDMAEPRLDFSVLSFTTLVSLLAGVAFGLAPALQASRTDLNVALKQAAGRGGAGAGRRLRGAFVVAQIALALVLLVGAGLLVQTLYRLREQYAGLRPETLLTVRTQLAENRYAEPARRAAFYDAVLARVKSLPGVVAAGYTTAVPLTRKGGSNGLTIDGRDNGPDSNWNANHRQVSADYFRAMGLAVRAGRGFAEQDDGNSLPVAVVNETMARAFWPGESPVGRRFKVGAPDSPEPWLTIVGVVADVRQMGADAPVKPEMYVPYRQAAPRWTRPPYSFFTPRDLVVRTSVEPSSLVPAVRRAVHEVDAYQPVAGVRTMDEVLGRETAQRRVGVILLAAFAALALLLSALGIYGVLAFFVVQHTPEIGVRMALGARPGDVLRLVVAKGMRLALAGVVLGLAGALALTRLMSSLLFGVSAADPLTYAGIALLLGTVALLACLIPARRATKVDPMVALRYE